MKKELKNKLIFVYTWVVVFLACLFGFLFSVAEDTLGLYFLFMAISIMVEYHYLSFLRNKKEKEVLGDEE